MAKQRLSIRQNGGVPAEILADTTEVFRELLECGKEFKSSGVNFSSWLV